MRLPQEDGALRSVRKDFKRTEETCSSPGRREAPAGPLSGNLRERNGSMSSSGREAQTGIPGASSTTTWLHGSLCGGW